MEAGSLCDRLNRLGFSASAYPCRGDKGFRNIVAVPPDVIVIDLIRMPSYGRVMGALIRERKSTRMIPLVFVEGDPEKARRVRELLPDAVFTDLPRIGPAVERAIRRAPQEPMMPAPPPTSLADKLRIREGAVIALLDAPAGFEARLDPLPPGTKLQKEIGDADVVLAFVKSPAGLGRGLPSLVREVRKGRTLWLVWPKKSGGGAGGLSMTGIREQCREVGLIDYKVCAVDEVWSGMAVARRKG